MAFFVQWKLTIRWADLINGNCSWLPLSLISGDKTIKENKSRVLIHDEPLFSIQVLECSVARRLTMLLLASLRASGTVRLYVETASARER